MLDQRERHKKWIKQKFPIFYTMDLNLQSCFTQSELSQLQNEIKEVSIKDLSKKAKVIYKKLKKYETQANNKFKSNKALYKILSSTFCQELNDIILNSQQIKSLAPLANKKFKKLIQLQLNSNKIDDFQPLTLSSFASLTHCDLSENGFKLLRGIQICLWQKLKVFNLSKNSIQSIQNIMSAEFPCLQKLILSQNRIISVECYSKANFKQMKILDLSFNFIKSYSGLPRATFAKLEELNLKNNPIIDINQMQKIQMTTHRRNTSNNLHDFVYYDYKIVFSKLFLKNQMQKLTIGSHSKHCGYLHMTIYKQLIKKSYQIVRKVFFYE